MSRDFDPRELGHGEDPELSGIVERLDSYARSTRPPEPRRGHVDRVMAAVDAGGGSSAGLAGWWGAIRGSRLFAIAQANVLLVLLFLLAGFGVAVAAGEVTGVINVIPDPTPGIETPMPSPDLTDDPGMSPFDSGFPADSGFADPSASPDNSAIPTPTP